VTNWKRIAGTATVVVALSLQIGHGLLSMNKIDYLRASNAQLDAAEKERPQLFDGKLTREQYAERCQDVERKCRQIWMERSFALDRYFIYQSYIMLAACVCLFAVGFAIQMGARQPSEAVQEPSRTPQETAAS
jgi:hypothetical protein